MVFKVNLLYNCSGGNYNSHMKRTLTRKGQEDMGVLGVQLLQKLAKNEDIQQIVQD
jgi:hypothetical protein